LKHRFLWPGLRYQRLWPALDIMAETWTSTTLAGSIMARIWISATLAGSGYYGRNWANYGYETSLDIFFFEQEKIGWVVFVSRGNNGSSTCNLDKERLTCVWEEKWRKYGRMRKPKEKNWHTMDICGYADFGYDIRCKRMREK